MVGEGSFGLNPKGLNSKDLGGRKTVLPLFRLVNKDELL